MTSVNECGQKLSLSNWNVGLAIGSKPGQSEYYILYGLLLLNSCFYGSFVMLNLFIDETLWENSFEE